MYKTETSGPVPSVLSNTDPAKCTADDFAAAFGYGGDEPERLTGADVLRLNADRPPYEFLSSACSISYFADDLRKARGAGPLSWGIAEQLPLIGGHICAGVDTLVLTITAQIGAGVIARLSELRQRATDGARVDVASGPFVWTLQPYGLKPHWRYVLEGPAVALKLRHSDKYGAVIQADLRAAFLWSVGVDRAVELVRELVERIEERSPPLVPWGSTRLVNGGPVKIPPARLDVARIDLCADFGGDMFTGDELNRGEFVTRARRRTTHRQSDPAPDQKVTQKMIDQLGSIVETLKPGGSAHDLRRGLLRHAGCGRAWMVGENISEHTRTTEHRSGRVFTGYSFGAGSLSARIYRKDLQLSAGACEWFRGIWKESGHKEGPVWRVEFQLRTEALKTFVAEGISSREWSHVRESLGGIWRELTGYERGARRFVRGWLTLRRKTGDRQQSRWPLSKAWRRVAAVDWPKGARVLRATEAIKRAAIGDAARADVLAAPPVQDNPQKCGAYIANQTGRAAADRLAPQLVGLAAAFVAASTVARGVDHDRTEQEACAEVVGAVSAALAQLSSSPEFAAVLRQKENELATRAAWRRLTSVRE